MLSKFFLDRPVFAWVIAIGIMIFGCIGLYRMPVSQYPSIAPPSIYVQAVYPGASAETVENTVTQIIEQKMTGLENLLYMSSTSDSSGTARIELTFAPGTDPDIAWTKVQNKLQLAMASLPSVVQEMGITVGKATKNFLLIVGLISEDGSMDGNDLRDYAQSNLEKVLARIPGVGEVQNFGTQYAMRIWFDPSKLVSYNLTVEDIIQAVKAYNVEVSAGQLGGAPAVEGQQINASIVVQHLLQTPEDFGAIPIRINPDGSILRIRDIGRVELGTEQYDVQFFYNGKPAAAMGIRLMPGANALETAERIKNKLDELSKYFPHGMKVVYPYDTTPFTRVAIKAVVKTLFEAVLLVFLIMWLFLGSLRATLIPATTVPVVLLGTFGILSFLGFSINMLTMFATVLAIGLLVDDAIVVVENVERLMREEGLSPKEAASKSMDQITSALIGIGVVLSAVFVPMALFGGSTGILYRQFSVTVISSMLLSVLVALILTPVLCANFLKPVPPGHRPSDSAFFIVRPFFRQFEKGFFWTRDFYVRLVERSFTRYLRYILAYIVIVSAVGFIFYRMPTAYLPDEDQGILLAQVMLPSGSTLEQTQKVLDKVRSYFMEHEKDTVESCGTLAGFSFAGRAQNNGMAFIKLKDWHLRKGHESKVWAVVGRAMAFFSQIKEARIFVFPPPSIIELGNATGFDLQLLDFGGLGHDKLMEARNQLLFMASKDPRVTRVRPSGMDDVPQYKLDVDWNKAGAMGIPISSIHRTIASAFGGSYINDFIHEGRVKKVYLQADTPYRMLPEDINRLYVRNTEGKMVPFSAFSSGYWVYGSPRLERYNGFPSINIWGEAAPGRSTGEAMKAMEELIGKLPEGIGFDWTGLSYQERMATAQAPLLYFFSVLVIFLCVAALYESWTIPFVNMLMLPLGVFGAIVATYLRGLPNGVYFQIGFITTLGLSTKNAILIIQFIKEGMKQGMGLLEATLSAVKIRFRPVIMTSLAFFFGTLPLTLASGAGAGSMNAIGTAVTGGLLSATFIDLLFIPFFFVLVSRVFGKGTYGKKLVGILVLSLLCFGCSLEPKYTRPDISIPFSLKDDRISEETSLEASTIKWEEFFGSSKLRELIKVALENNKDLKIATLNVERARALYGVQRAELFPSLSGSGYISIEKTSKDLSSTGTSQIKEQYGLSLAISSWEIDFFGRLRSLEKQALASYLATEEARRSAKISLISSVALAYITLAADKEALKIAQATLETQEHYYNLIRERYRAGLTNELDLRRASSQVESARLEVLKYLKQIEQDENALTLLLGKSPPKELLPKDLEDAMPVKEFLPNLSSEVLLKRPDILQAEYQLEAAYANIGAARAALFPRISLTTSVGTASDELTGLFGSGGGLWTFSPRFVVPLFDARTWAALRVTKVDKELALAQYERAIQNAFREVADVLVVKKTIGEELKAQQALVEDLSEAYKLSMIRYEKGIDNYLSVLDAQRSLYLAEQKLVSLRLSNLSTQVRLYAVLGGGAL